MPACADARLVRAATFNRKFSKINVHGYQLEVKEHRDLLSDKYSIGKHRQVARIIALGFAGDDHGR